MVRSFSNDDCGPPVRAASSRRGDSSYNAARDGKQLNQAQANALHCIEPAKPAFELSLENADVRGLLLEFAHAHPKLIPLRGLAGAGMVPLNSPAAHFGRSFRRLASKRAVPSQSEVVHAHSRRGLIARRTGSRGGERSTRLSRTWCGRVITDRPIEWDQPSARAGAC